MGINAEYMGTPKCQSTLTNVCGSGGIESTEFRWIEKCLQSDCLNEVGSGRASEIRMWRGPLWTIGFTTLDRVVYNPLDVFNTCVLEHKMYLMQSHSLSTWIGTEQIAPSPSFEGWFQ